MNIDLHRGQPVAQAGELLEQARAVMIMVHGRGTTAESILSLVPEIDQPGFAYLAPQAMGNTWYPHSFLAPLADNEPYLSSALVAIEDTVTRVGQAGVPRQQILLLGFSQGACLILEFAARHAQQYGGLVGLSGGLIGPDDTPRNYTGSLDDTPVFLGCSDTDPHIPQARVHHSATVLSHLGGIVTKRLYPNMGHTINRDELNFVRMLMKSLLV